MDWRDAPKAALDLAVRHDIRWARGLGGDVPMPPNVLAMAGSVNRVGVPIHISSPIESKIGMPAGATAAYFHAENPKHRAIYLNRLSRGWAFPYQVIFHELTHYTGGTPRFYRTSLAGGIFRTIEMRQEEEMIAETCALMCCIRSNRPHSILHSGAYLRDYGNEITPHVIKTSAEIADFLLSEK